MLHTRGGRKDGCDSQNSFIAERVKHLIARPSFRWFHYSRLIVS